MDRVSESFGEFRILSEPRKSMFSKTLICVSNLRLLVKTTLVLQILDNFSDFDLFSGFFDGIT